MFFCSNLPRRPALIVAPEAQFLTSGSSRKRERQDSSLRRREARIGGWPEIQKPRPWRCGTSGWRMWRRTRSLSETRETESRPNLELNLKARPLGGYSPRADRDALTKSIKRSQAARMNCRVCVSIQLCSSAHLAPLSSAFGESEERSEACFPAASKVSM